MVTPASGGRRVASRDGLPAMVRRRQQLQSAWSSLALQSAQRFPWWQSAAISGPRGRTFPCCGGGDTCAFIQPRESVLARLRSLSSVVQSSRRDRRYSASSWSATCAAICSVGSGRLQIPKRLKRPAAYNSLFRPLCNSSASPARQLTSTSGQPQRGNSQ